MIDMDKCFAGEYAVTEDEFNSVGPAAKGYLVYMLGSRPDQPNVPENYTPGAREKDDFLHGQQVAVTEAQDSP